MPYEYLSYGRAADITDRRDRFIYRLLELQPGVLAWLTLIAVVAASYWMPVYAAVFIIIFDLYWLIKTIYLSLHMSHTFRAMRSNQRVDWMPLLAGTTPYSQELSGVTWEDI